MTSRRYPRRGAGIGRYAVLLRTPSDPDGGRVVWDSHRQRVVRRFPGISVFRGRHAMVRADDYAGRLNRRGR